jgi:signal peptidase II
MQKNLRYYLNSYSFLLIVAGIIVAIDQYTKELVRQNIPLGGTWMPLEWLSPYARFVNWFNTGAAFGLFKNGSLFFAVLAVIVMALILYYFPKVGKHEIVYRIAMAMQFAGAAGNFIDRVRLNGKVTDFISVGNFAVFNVADASITVGCIVLLLGSWYKDYKEGKSRGKQASIEVKNSDISENKTDG